MLPNTLANGSYINSDVRKELNWALPISIGAKKISAQRVQEWLTYSGFGTPIDADFGPATELRVKDFQASKKLNVTGSVDQQTFEALVDPLVKAVAPLNHVGKTLSRLVCDFAAQHVALHPIEIGGENRGPWVRAYMGWEGNDAKWCAGFACFILQQAANALGIKLPITPSQGVDAVVLSAKHNNHFVPGNRVMAGAFPKAQIVPGSFFVVRNTSADWTHIGIVSAAQQDAFRTFEGNTDSGGSSNGFEATARARGYAKKDFIIW